MTDPALPTIGPSHQGPSHQTTPIEQIRVLVVDDQPLIRRGMALMLASEPDIAIVGQAANGEEALALAREHQPNVVLMDLQMPRMGGVAATRVLTAELPATQVVILTTFDTDDLVFEAIRAGAQAYLLKDATEAELLETIRGVHRGESHLAPHIARKVMEQFRQLPGPRVAPASPPATNVTNVTNATNVTTATISTSAISATQTDEGGDALDPLTQREERILALIAEGKSNREIANLIFLAEGTVKNYVSRIMDKLHARTRTELAVKALRATK